MRYMISPACSGATPGSPTSWTYPEDAQEGLDQVLKPPQLAPFDIKKQQLLTLSHPDLSRSLTEARGLR